MVRKLLFGIVFLFSAFIAFAQNGNEWIDYSQKYLTFKVAATGWYRIDYAVLQPALQNIGIDLSVTSTDRIQLFGKETEQPLKIQDGGDGILHPGDYIEFRAEKNDGWKDSLLFDDPSTEMADDYYSFVNDTLIYFISISNSSVGKRYIPETDVNTASYPSALFCWVSNFSRLVTSNYNYGPLVVNQSSPTYGMGEGWTGNPIKSSTSTTTTNNTYKIDVSINTRNAFTSSGAPNAIIKSSISSASDPSVSGLYNHRFMLQYGTSMTTVVDSSFSGYKLIKNFAQINPSTLVNGNTVFRHRGVSIGQGNNEKLMLSSVTIDYPHTFDFEGKSDFAFSLTNSVSKQVISISNVSGSDLRLFVLNDLAAKEIPLVVNGSNLEAVIPNNLGNDSIQLWLKDVSNFNSVSSMVPVNGTGDFTDFSAIDPSKGYIIVSHASLMSSVNDYANYRSSLAGGGYGVVVADIEELYLQYGGGVEKHPVAIRSFVQDAFDSWNEDPEHLFLMGKSISNKANDGGSRENINSFTKNLVPTWGYPGSDNHITQGVNNSGKSYGISTGRLSVTTNQEIWDYLNKITIYESDQDPNSFYDIPSKEWQKNALFLGGGDDSLTINVIKAYFHLYESIISDSAMGAMTFEYHRDPFSTQLPLQIFYEVQEHLEKGTSIINFYGHSSAGTGFTVNINDPQNWNNPGKNPVVIGLGCYTGDVHNYDDNVYAIELVNVPDVGGICLISTVSQGFLTNIGYYGELFYKSLSDQNYGKSTGFHMKHACDSIFALQGSQYWGIINEANYVGMSMQGDPAIVAYSHQRPELVLDENRVWTVPAQIDLSVDTFELYVVATNIGRAFDAPFAMSVERVTPEGIDTTYIKDLTHSYNRDTIVFSIPTNHATSSGLNKFNISIDLPNSVIIEQQDEIGNNQITYSTYITSNGLSPIWPYEYMIIPYDTISLKASTLDPFEPLKNYVIEIDTVRSFSSPFKKHQQFQSVGGVIEAHPQDWINQLGGRDSLVFTDSTVYFWRCSVDSTVKTWMESSFQYIPGRWGWAQAHFQQFEDDYFQGIDYDTLNRTFNFGNNFSKLHVTTYSSCGNWSTPSFQGTLMTLNGDLLDYGGPDGQAAILVAVIDPCSLRNWKTPFMNGTTALNEDNCFGQFNGDPSVCPGTSLMGRNREHGFFAFRYKTPAEMDSLATFLTDKIPDGFYVVAYTFIPNNYTAPSSLYGAMPPDLIAAFQDLGATNISSSQPDDGWILLAQKGFPSNTIEIHTPDTISSGVSYPSQGITVDDTIQGCEVGYIVSEIVGPAFQWNQIHWEQRDFELVNADSTRLRVYGITNTATKTLLIDTLMTDLDSMIQIDQLIDANIYPLLQLEAEYHDTVALTPAQIVRWQVVYSPVPELAINPKKGLYIKNEEFLEGDSAKFAVAIENVSDFDMDSLLVEYWNISQYGNRTSIGYPRQDSLKKYEILLDTISYSTKGLTSTNYFWIIANPYINSYDQDQLEQFYFNNLAERSLDIDKDDINPILDVTFDGVHIINEDIVSAKPNILITLDDENPFLLLDELDDTAYFEIYLRMPEENTYKRIYFMSGGQQVLTWTPAENEKNKFKIEYNPNFTKDGIYTLKVQGRDKSNNVSGDYSYEIDFEVVTASTITHLYNYPNPFSTHTQFVFTLTGSELPDELQIQIMTVTGKVVREIDLFELGTLRIGNNITEYAWDGRDQFGDQLANGIYLYRVIAKINGQEIDHRATSADSKAFHKGFGKMYLLR